jgi:ribonuclease G
LPLKENGKLDKELLISSDRNETRAAILESKQVTQLYFERRGKKSLVGNIYIGKVKNVLPGLDAAFVDIGEDKNAFLYVNEVGFSDDIDSEVEISRKIQHILKPNQMIMVQVTKDPMKTKGARLTTFISIPGRYLVLAPFNKGIGVSRKIAGDDRDKLKKVVETISNGEEYGLIVRTAAKEADEAKLKKDLKQLIKKWAYIRKKASTLNKPELISSEYSLIIKLVRDIFSEDFSAIYVSKRVIKREIERYLRSIGIRFNNIIVHHGDEDLFDAFDVNEVIESALERKVWLKSGGFIVIDHGEAMTTIDVNTGKYTSSKSSAQTILRTNIEAAETIASQIRIRDIGGIIVIDFIDMAGEKDRKKVYNRFMQCLANDRTKTEVLHFSKLGLIEMTRKNVSDGILGTLCRVCPECSGSGFVKSEETIKLEIERKIRKLAKESSSKGFLIKLNSAIAAQIIGSDGRNLKHIENITKKYINIQGDSKLPLDTFLVVAEGTVGEIKDAAQPFKEGDILNLVVEEPYMHNKNDAISRINGYVIQIIDASKYIGQRLKVEIKSVSKTSAVAEIQK